ncbi:hypothetical protein FACS1894151_10770 [Spirochaetia bacterium]|nr:hypothetical protein FACS1894151_10770 [Spirochaetia bacterium]
MDEEYMESNIALEKNERRKDILLSQIRECFGRVVYSHKTHEKCADILGGYQSYLKYTQIIISAILSGSLLTALFQNGFAFQVLTAILSMILTAINLFFKSNDFGKRSQEHRECASLLWDIRECYTSLIVDLQSGIVELEEFINRRDDLQKRLSMIYASAPSTNNNAYKEAQKALKYKEDMTFSDVEIDAFLPSLLKQSNQNGRKIIEQTKGEK